MKQGSYGSLGLVLSHGFTMALTVYLAYRGGEWLDGRFGTSPWLMLTAVLLMVVANLHLLVKEVLAESGSKPKRRVDVPPEEKKK